MGFEKKSLVRILYNRFTKYVLLLVLGLYISCNINELFPSEEELPVITLQIERIAFTSSDSSEISVLVDISFLSNSEYLNDGRDRFSGYIYSDFERSNKVSILDYLFVHDIPLSEKLETNRGQNISSWSGISVSTDLDPSVDLNAEIIRDDILYLSGFREVFAGETTFTMAKLLLVPSSHQITYY